jgi:hypothetical protein
MPGLDASGIRALALTVPMSQREAIIDLVGRHIEPTPGIYVTIPVSCTRSNPTLVRSSFLLIDEERRA